MTSTEPRNKHDSSGSMSFMAGTWYEARLPTTFPGSGWRGQNSHATATVCLLSYCTWTKPWSGDNVLASPVQLQTVQKKAETNVRVNRVDEHDSWRWKKARRDKNAIHYGLGFFSAFLLLIFLTSIVCHFDGHGLLRKCCTWQKKRVLSTVCILSHCQLSCNTALSTAIHSIKVHHLLPCDAAGEQRQKIFGNGLSPSNLVPSAHVHWINERCSAESCSPFCAKSKHQLVILGLRFILAARHFPRWKETINAKKGLKLYPRLSDAWHCRSSQVRKLEPNHSTRWARAEPTVKARGTYSWQCVNDLLSKSALPSGPRVVA